LTDGGVVGARSGLAYGALGLPLAFVALPLYVVLPNHYASAFGVPLAALGALLLGARRTGRTRTHRVRGRR
jgi:Na+/melibiose symporter-like transporter